jgi:hypothetical protein
MKTFRLIDTYEDADLLFGYDASDILNCGAIAFFECFESDETHARFKAALDTLAVNVSVALDDCSTLTRVS